MLHCDWSVGGHLKDVQHVVAPCQLIVVKKSGSYFLMMSQSELFSSVVFTHHHVSKAFDAPLVKKQSLYLVFNGSENKRSKSYFVPQPVSVCSSRMNSIIIVSY